MTINRSLSQRIKVGYNITVLGNITLSGNITMSGTDSVHWLSLNELRFGADGGSGLVVYLGRTVKVDVPH